MVTIYKFTVPCSYCGKLREISFKGYCSGACKVRAHRDKSKLIEKDINVTDGLQKKPDETPKLQMAQVLKKNIKIKGRMTPYGIQLCQHGKPYGQFCEECGV
jgi:hypothetical protein